MIDDSKLDQLEPIRTGYYGKVKCVKGIVKGIQLTCNLKPDIYIYMCMQLFLSSQKLFSHFGLPVFEIQNNKYMESIYI